MLAVADEPAVRAQMHPISVETYHRLGEIGALSERTELIRGAVIDQLPRTPLHSSIVQRLDRYLLKVLPEALISRPEQPLSFIDSEPEPDLSVVLGSLEDYVMMHPQTAELVMEVCVTSEDLDRIKLGVYAEAGIKECWLILADSQTLERHTDPIGGVYGEVERAVFPQPIESLVLAGLRFPPPLLFPSANRPD